MTNLTLSNINDFVGRELGVSGWMTVDQSKIDRFADCTGDRQWIHVDVDRAKRERPFRGPIAHGYLTLSLIAPLAMEIGVVPTDAAAGLNYGLDKVRFLAPVKAGARVRLRVVLVGVEPKEAGQLVVKTKNTLEIDGSDKPALIAETLALLIPGGPQEQEDRDEQRTASGT
jgi:acyl dehydratase